MLTRDSIGMELDTHETTGGAIWVQYTLLTLNGGGYAVRGTVKHLDRDLTETKLLPIMDLEAQFIQSDAPVEQGYTCRHAMIWGRYTRHDDKAVITL